MMIRMVSTLVGLLVLCLTGGCLFSNMDTARQLDEREVAISGSVDANPIFPLPRAQAKAMWGLGPGDLSLHGGMSIATFFNAGFGARLYMSEHLTAGVQVDAAANVLAASDQDIIGWVAATPKVTTTVEEGRPLYGGVQATLVTAQQLDAEFEADEFALMPGVVLGVEFPLHGGLFGASSWQMQLTAVPMMINDFQGAPMFVFEGGKFMPDIPVAPAISQIGFGVTWGDGWSGEPEREIEPTEQPAPQPQPEPTPDPQPDAEPEPEPEPDDEPPEPEYDDQGVPVY